jgi:hypothetical protein
MGYDQSTLHDLSPISVWETVPLLERRRIVVDRRLLDVARLRTLENR